MGRLLCEVEGAGVSQGAAGSPWGPSMHLQAEGVEQVQQKVEAQGAWCWPPCRPACPVGPADVRGPGAGIEDRA